MNLKKMLPTDPGECSVPNKTAGGRRTRSELRVNAAFQLLLLFSLALAMSLPAVKPALADDVTIQFNGGGANNEVYLGEENTLQILIQNFDPLSGMSIGFQSTSAVPGFSWKTPYGNKPNSGPKYVQEYGDAVDKFAIGLFVNTTQLPGRILIGGADDGTLPLPSHFFSTMLYEVKLIMPDDPGLYYANGFCIDNLDSPPIWAWVFTPVGGFNFSPQFQGGISGPVCFNLVHRDCSGSMSPFHYRINGDQIDHLSGFSVAGVGDVNGDGKSDFIIGRPRSETPLVDAGSALVYSGANGSILYWMNGEAAGDQFGYSVAGAGDVNGDGRPDFMVGAYTANPGGVSDAGSAYVYSGLNGSLLHKIDGDQTDHWAGQAVAGVGDVNGDGKADFIIGRPGSESGPFSNAGSALVYSGANGSVLYWVNGETHNDVLGWSVAGAGDVNGDGRPDFIIGAPWADPAASPPNSNAGSAYVYSGLNGSLLYRINGDQFDHNSGWSVAGVGDVNGDNKADFIIGRPGSESGPLVDAGSALVYSGANGSVLHWINGEASGDQLGYSVAGAGDVNADGRPDFIIGAPFANHCGYADAGTVYLCSGLDGSLIYRRYGFPGLLGWSVAGAGDVNGDGGADFITGAPYADPSASPPNSNAGSVFVYLGSPNVCGDADGSTNVDISDAVYLIQYIFQGGPAPNPLLSGDADCSGNVDISDAVYLIQYIFQGGPAPCASCK